MIFSYVSDSTRYYTIAMPEIARDSSKCVKCSRGGAGEKVLLCAGCHAVAYCSKKCQHEDWKSRHKRLCAPLVIKVVLL